MAEYDHITRDLAHKAGEDAVEAVKRALALAPGGVDKQSLIAFMAAGEVMAVAAAYMAHKLEAQFGESVSPDAVVDALFSTMRPITLSAVSTITIAGSVG